MSAGEIPLALLAGFLSFLAPCVLPLVPGYLSAVSAVNADELGRPGTSRRVVVSSVPFVLGFTVFFVLLGVGASLVGGRLFRDQFLLEQVSGFVLVVFGFAFMVVGGLAGFAQRLGVAQPGSNRPHEYARSFSLHVTVLAVLALPAIWSGLATHLVPLQIGANRVDVHMRL